MLRAARVLLLTLSLSPQAFACSLDVDSTTTQQWIGTTGQGYDVFDPTTLYQPLTVNVRAVDGSCSYYVTVVPAAANGTGGLLTGPGASLDYTIYRDATGRQVLQATPTATELGVLAGDITAGAGEATYQVAYSVPPQQVVPPGDYTGQITVSAYEGKVGTGILRAQHQVTIAVHVPSVTEMSFSEGLFDPDKTSYTIPFGQLHKGDIRGVTLHARSNSGYRILLRSENGSAMRDVDPTDSSTVTYQCFMDGRPISLGKSDTEGIQSSTLTDALGRAHRIDFQIGDIGGATAGDYKDVITLTVISLH